ncbi:hypothetical protein [Paenibacillus illinoisensis]|uniref:hypothetical protein n=1 Tax=Paenibacillus illinoisensis TaxID=59845 RepID=UPI001C646A7C|nr:hypothetical protein [Paenibacillus illinoisensis]
MTTGRRTIHSGSVVKKSFLHQTNENKKIPQNESWISFRTGGMKALRSNYQEVKNYLHNDLGVTKGYVQDLLKEMVAEEVKKLISSGYIEHAVEIDVSSRVGKTFGRGLGSNFESNVRGIIAKEVGKQLVENMNISVTKADDPQEVNFIYHIDN